MIFEQIIIMIAFISKYSIILIFCFGTCSGYGTASRQRHIDHLPTLTFTKHKLPQKRLSFAHSTPSSISLHAAVDNNEAEGRISSHTSSPPELLEQVRCGIENLYPQADIEKRNAKSREDGYWKFINDGIMEPPKQYTYGEFDLYFFSDLLDLALDYYFGYNNIDCNTMKSWENKTFCDIGSGTGRLVLAASALHSSFHLCRGVEILKGIHEEALKNYERCRSNIDTETTTLSSTQTSSFSSYSKPSFSTITSQKQEEDAFFSDVLSTLSSFDSSGMNEFKIDDTYEQEEEEEEEEEENGEYNETKDQNEDIEIRRETDTDGGEIIYELPIPISEGNSQETNSLPLAPIEFINGSFDDPYLHLSDIDVAFVFSSCMGPDVLQSLSYAIGRQCHPGTIIITTDYPLILEGTIPSDPEDSSLPHGDYKLEVLKQIDGYCEVLGGCSTACIHVVKTSLHSEYGINPRSKPQLPIEDQAYKIIKAFEEKSLSNTDKFLREVYNSMVFSDMPAEWSSNLLKNDEDKDEEDPNVEIINITT